MFDKFPDDIDYKVVINHEEQYSIWPSDLVPPSGWKKIGKGGSKKECLEYFQELDDYPLLEKIQAEMAEKARNSLRKG
jgi:MbtH protein